MKLHEYGASISLKPAIRAYLTYETRDRSLDLIGPCRSTNYKFIAGNIYIHNEIAATIRIEKCVGVIVVKINPNKNYIGHSYVQLGSLQKVSSIAYPEKMIMLERVVNRLRTINRMSNPLKMRIKFNNVVAKWSNQQNEIK